MALLESIRVVELTAGIVGPLAGRQLADLGAEVIKVEVPATAGRTPRNTQAVNGEVAPWDNDPTFNCLNRGKLSCVLDLQHPDGRTAFTELVRNVDVLLTNFSARVLPNLGFDFESLRTLNEQIVLVQITGYGRTGPKRDWVAFGPTIESVTGMAALNEIPSVGPSVTTLPILDLASAARATSLVLAALTRRQEVGPQLLDVSMQETAMLMMAPECSAVRAGEVIDHQEANTHPSHVPYGVFGTADGEWLAINVEGDAAWLGLVAGLRQSWAAQHSAGFPEPDPSWARHPVRMEQREDVQAWTSSVVSQLAGVECESALLSASVDVSLVVRPRQLVENRVLRESRLFVRRGHAVAGPRTYPTFPLLWDGERPVSATSPPRFGEHSKYVLRDIAGLSPKTFERLQAGGITYQMEQG